LNLVVEIRANRGEDAVVKKPRWIPTGFPGVNHIGTYGRWAFVELRDVYEMEADFEAKISSRGRSHDL